nr:NAD(P)H-hydrate dehydratase [Candidatus Omnitrophota bacterium]
GLVTLGIPESINQAVIKIKYKEVMTLPLPETREGTLSKRALDEILEFVKGVTVVVVGPGLSLNTQTQGLVRAIIKAITVPLVLDADALNALAGNYSALSFNRYSLATKIITPHPGEMARLQGVSIQKVQRNREAVARAFAKEHKVTVVLKGHHTVVADIQGNVYINKTGNPGMATAGSGDVLTGMIAALMAQGLSAFNAAKYAVYLHGFAGDLAAQEKSQLGMIASDIIDKLPEAIKKCS